MKTLNKHIMLNTINEDENQNNYMAFNSTHS